MKTVSLLFSAALTFLSVVRIGEVKFNSTSIDCCNGISAASAKRARFNPKIELDSSVKAALKRLDKKIAVAKKGV